MAEAARFASWWQSLETRPIVTALMEKAEDIRHKQLNKTLKKIRPLSDDERDSLEAMTRSIVTKILSDPIQCLKSNGYDNRNYNEVISELFQLHTEKQE